MFETLYFTGAVITFAIFLLGVWSMYQDGEDVKMNQIIMGIAIAVIPIINLIVPVVVLYMTITAIFDFTVIKGKK